MRQQLLTHEPLRLPAATWTSVATQWAGAGLVHVLMLGALALALPRVAPAPALVVQPEAVAATLPRIVFMPSAMPGGGGGGGGNRQRGPIRHAESRGRDAVTLRTGRVVAPAESVAPADTAPPLLLDARPLASGAMEQLGLPVGGVSFGTSTGPGSGGGVGTGTGAGLGSGQGPGVGPGSGGGIGGGVYRPGGGVSAPCVIVQVRPTYTSDALSAKIQGSVWLELVVTREGRADAIRVVRSLDPGLDAEAISAVRQWRFEPGRMGRVSVDVLVTVVMDFAIR